MFWDILISTAYAQPADSSAAIPMTLPQNYSILKMITGSDIIIQMSMLTLFLISVTSWAIIGTKLKTLRQDEKKNNGFFKKFFESSNIDHLVKEGKFTKSPAFNVFKCGIESLREHKDRGVDRIAREIRRALDEQIDDMEYRVSFLATASSVAPFIGLFGTIWGILHIFWKIGKTGISSLTIIGPNIADALVTTAAGLMVAIPAVFFYNHFINRIRQQTNDLSEFTEDFINRIEKEYY